jgi:hypothetical protein
MPARQLTRKFADAMTVDPPAPLCIRMGGATRSTGFIDDRSTAWTIIVSVIPACVCRR